MQRFVKGLGIAVFILLLVAAIGISATVGWRPFIGPRSRALTDRKFEVTAERQKRGAYLAEHVAGCTDCHTPTVAGSAGPEIVRAKMGAGQIFPLPGFPGTLVAPNLTPDAETGTGKWSDDQLARAIREGISHDGHTLFPFMPYSHFRSMSDEDLASVIVYLRSLPPVHNPLPRSVVNFPLKYLVNGVPEPITAPVLADLSTPVAQGKYLVTLAVCSACHTPSKRGEPIRGMQFAGGEIFELPSGKIASANITPDPTTGIGNYSEEMFVKVLRTGFVGTRQLNTFMPWQFYSGQTDEDLKAMYAYSRTVPPVSHHVDNSKPGTLCRKCAATHGAGDTN